MTGVRRARNKMVNTAKPNPKPHSASAFLESSFPRVAAAHALATMTHGGATVVKTVRV
jgi:hypothetical protein